MATVKLSLPGQVAPGGAQPKMIITTLSGSLAVEVPYAPKEATYAGLGPTYQTIDRPGRRPYISRQYESSPAYTYTFNVTYTDPTISIEPIIQTLYQIINSHEATVIKFGLWEANMWYVTDFSIATKERQPGTNFVTRADVSMTFTQVPDVNGLGPASGGTQIISTLNSVTSHQTPRFYVVKAGDTLTGIATSILHNTALWTSIAVLNGIRDPLSIQPGQTLVLPV